MDEELRPLGLSISQYAILEALLEEGESDTAIRQRNAYVICVSHTISSNGFSPKHPSLMPIPCTNSAFPSIARTSASQIAKIPYRIRRFLSWRRENRTPSSLYAN